MHMLILVLPNLRVDQHLFFYGEGSGHWDPRLVLFSGDDRSARTDAWERIRTTVARRGLKGWRVILAQVLRILPRWNIAPGEMQPGGSGVDGVVHKCPVLLQRGPDVSTLHYITTYKIETKS